MPICIFTLHMCFARVDYVSTHVRSVLLSQYDVTDIMMMMWYDDFCIIKVTFSRSQQCTLVFMTSFYTQN